MRKLLLTAFVSLVGILPTLSVASSTCPRPQPYSGACIQVIVWAKNPSTGVCCQYSTPCAAPSGWTVFYSEEECADVLPLCSALEGKSCSPYGKSVKCRYENGTTGIASCEDVWVIL